MSGNFIIEDHGDLTSIGTRTHAELDTDLDTALNQLSQLNNWNSFSVELTPAHLVSEISPGIVRIPLLPGQTFADAKKVFARVDGRSIILGLNGVQLGVDDVSIEVFVPTDLGIRALYTAGVTYDIEWLS